MPPAAPRPPGVYRGAAFLPELKGGSVAGPITVSSGGVQFAAAERSMLLPLAGLRIREGGHNGDKLFFEHPEFPKASIYTDESAILQEPAFQTNGPVAERIREIQRARKHVPVLPVLGIGVLLFLVLLVVGFILAKDRIISAIANRLPVSWEVNFGEQIFKQIQSEHKMLKNSPWERNLEPIKKRLLPLVRTAGYPFEFHIMQDTNVNAFALPGGHVVILTGLLEQADSAEEVAGVLAHELAHVTKKHLARKAVESAGLFLIVQAFLGDTTGLLAVLSSSGRYLLQQKFSRDFEREADDAGWDYLVRARIDPRGMTRFFEKLREIEPTHGRDETSLQLLATHPATTERITRLEHKWGELSEKKSFVPLGDWRKNDH